MAQCLRELDDDGRVPPQEPRDEVLLRGHAALETQVEATAAYARELLGRGHRVQHDVHFGAHGAEMLDELGEGTEEVGAAQSDVDPALDALRNTLDAHACFLHSLQDRMHVRQQRVAGVRQLRLAKAQASQMTAQELPFLLLQDELDRRQRRLIDRRYKDSHLDEKLTLAEIDWSFNPKVPRAACFELQTLSFVNEGANALLIGKPGTGKSQVAKAVGNGQRLRPVGMSGWSAIVFQRGDHRREVIAIDDLLPHLDAWERQ